MSTLDTILKYVPQVEAPTEKKLAFGTKTKWTLVALFSYFILKNIPVYGASESFLAQFDALAMILGAEFGSLVSLGIGPIVTASIMMQLLNGSGILKFDTGTEKGKARFQGVTKLVALILIFVESIVFVYLGGITPEPALLGTDPGLYNTLQFLIIFQLILGGLIILFLDDLVGKWGFGTGIGLFIAAGVSENLFKQAFSWFANPDNPEFVTGAVWAVFQYFAAQEATAGFLAIASILTTILVFGLVVYVQSMKVEIPLSFGKVRGYGMRWPLNFLYTSNIPVILIAALLANIQFMTALLQNRFPDRNIELFTQWFIAPNQGTGGLVGAIISQGGLNIGSTLYLQAISYSVILMVGSMVFAYFWMQTSGMDPKSQAKQIMNSGLQIPGFRKDPRIMEHVLTRYITPLTIMGGLAVGFLAALADLSGALTSGTGILLAVMIIYKLYEEIAKQHAEDMNPALKKLMGK
ncbi:MAG: preprotein translocase subunit SecY [Candidatus Woesearchaeota archaeon]